MSTYSDSRVGAIIEAVYIKNKKILEDLGEVLEKNFQ